MRWTPPQEAESAPGGGGGGHSEYCWYPCMSKNTSKKGLFSDLKAKTSTTSRL